MASNFTEALSEEVCARIAILSSGWHHQHHRWEKRASMKTMKGKPVRAAFCVVGLARSFTRRVVYRSQQRNLIEAFGAAESRVFWRIKLRDEMGRRGAKANKSFSVTHADFAGAKAVMRPEEWQWQPGENVKKVNVNALPDNEYHMWQNDLQIKGIRDCWTMVEKYEKRRSQVGSPSWRFDVVFKLRTDLIFIRSFPHFSEIDLKMITVMRDWLWMVPRAMAPQMFFARGCGKYNFGEESMMSIVEKHFNRNFQFQCAPAFCQHAWFLNITKYPRWSCLPPAVSSSNGWGDHGVPTLRSAKAATEDSVVDEYIEQWHAQAACSVCAHLKDVMELHLMEELELCESACQR